jgi:hypothetical protein
MAEKVQVVEPKSVPERQQMGRARTRLFELSLRCIERAEEILNDPDADRKDVVAVMRLCWDRVFPTIARVHQTGTVQHNVNMPDVDWSEIHRRAIEKGREGERADSRIH